MTCQVELYCNSVVLFGLKHVSALITSHYRHWEKYGGKEHSQIRLWLTCLFIQSHFPHHNGDVSTAKQTKIEAILAKLLTIFLKIN